MTKNRLPGPKVKWTIFLILIVVGSLPVWGYEFAGGTGRPDNPYQIATAQQLLHIGSDPVLLQKSYVLVADLDFHPDHSYSAVFQKALIAGHAAEPIAQAPMFTGHFYGNGHTISHLHIQAPDGCFLGLFGIIGKQAIINGVHLRHVQIIGKRHVGAMAGKSSGVITNCTSSGNVQGETRVGGLIGSGMGSLSNCCSTSKVKATYDIVGGLLGHGLAETSLTACHSAGYVSGREHVGGLVGQMLAGTLFGCFSSGQVHSQTNAGGLTGAGPYCGTIIGCYTRAQVHGDLVGGLVGIAQRTRIKDSHVSGTLTQHAETKPAHNRSNYRGIGGLVGYWRSSREGEITSCCWDREKSKVSQAVGQRADRAHIELAYTKGISSSEMSTANGPVDCLSHIRLSGICKKSLFHDHGKGG